MIQWESILDTVSSAGKAYRKQSFLVTDKQHPDVNSLTLETWFETSQQLTPTQEQNKKIPRPEKTRQQA